MAIQTRRGNSAYYDETKMKSGEIAVSQDDERAYLAFHDGSAEELAFKRDLAGLGGGGNGGGGVTVHSQLSGRNSPNQHPISAITGLQEALDAATSGGGGGSVNIPSDTIEVVQSVESATNDVIYVLDEEPDGTLEDALDDYFGKSHVLRFGSIDLDDGHDGDKSISADCHFIKTSAANILIDIGRLQDMDNTYGYPENNAPGSRIIEGLLEAGITRLDYIFISHYHADHVGCINSHLGGELSTSPYPSGLKILWDDPRIDTDNCVVVLPTMPNSAALNVITSSDNTEIAYCRGRLFGTTYCGGFFADHPEVRAYTLPVEGGYWQVGAGIDENALTAGETVSGYDSDGRAVSTSIQEWSWSAEKPKGGVIIRAHNCSREKQAYYASNDVGRYNDYCTVLEVEYGYTRVTFAADTSGNAQRALYTVLQQTDVLKLGHHMTDVDWHQPFYEKLNPRYAIACVDNEYFKNIFEYQQSPDSDNFRPAIAWLAAHKIPIYPLCFSGSMIFESDGSAVKLLTNNRNHQPITTEGNLLWEDPSGAGVGAGGKIDMSNTGWQNYRLFQLTLPGSGTSILAMLTRSGGLYFRGVGGYVTTSNPYTYHVNGTVEGDVITLVAASSTQHKTSSHTTSYDTKILAIYGLC